MEWRTTAPDPHRVSFTMDKGQRGWKLHLVKLGKLTSPLHGGIDVSRALCGLVPSHGWCLDLFIEDRCSVCVRIAARAADHSSDA